MFKNILLPIELAEEQSCQASLPVALDYAKAFKSKIWVMTAIPDIGMSYVSRYFEEDVIDKVTGEIGQGLKKFVKDNIPASIKVETNVRRGTVYDCIIEEMRAVKADLIIMSASRPELKDYLLGPNAARVVRHSNCSVLVVRE